LEAAWLKLARLRERDLSDRIRERAYEMWIASGRDGEAERVERLASPLRVPACARARNH
jgi:hypothetical protein